MDILSGSDTGGGPAWWAIMPIVLFWGAWVFGIIHCFRRKEFYPVFSRTRATRIFWGLSFLLMSPAMLALYYVFGVFMPAKGAPAWWRSALVLVPALLVVVFMVPGLAPDLRGVSVQVRDGESGELATPGGSGVSAHAGVDRRELNSQFTMSAVATGNDALLVMSSVWIQEQDDHPLVRETARALHDHLASMAIVDRIGWGPPGTGPPIDSRGFDCYITLAMPEKSGMALAGYRSLRGTLHVKMEKVPFHGNHHVSDHHTPPLVESNGQGTFDFSFRYVGLETPQSRYGRSGEALGKAIYERLVKTIENQAKKHGAPVNLPDALYGPIRPTPALPFPDAATLKIYGTSFGLLSHNHTIWRMTTPFDGGATVDEFVSSLRAAGWHGENHSNDHDIDYLRFNRDEDVIWMVNDSSKRHPAGGTETEAEGSESIYYVHYEDRFDTEAYRAALENLLDARTQEDVLLAFKSGFKQTGLNDLFIEHLAQRASGSIGASVAMAYHYHNSEQPESARDLARRAEVFAWFDPAGNTGDQVTALLETLGLEPLDRSTWDREQLQEFGGIALDDAPFPVTRVVAPGQPVILYWGARQTMYAASVKPAAGEQWTFCWHETGGGFSSWGESKYRVAEDGAVPRVWHESLRIDDNRHIRLEIAVKHLVDGQIQITVQSLDSVTASVL